MSEVVDEHFLENFLALGKPENYFYNLFLKKTLIGIEIMRVIE